MDCKVEGILPEKLGVTPGPVARLWQRLDVTPSQSQSEPPGPGSMLVISWAYSIFSQKVLQGSAGWQAILSYLLHRPCTWINVIHRVGNTVWILSLSSEVFLLSEKSTALCFLTCWLVLEGDWSRELLKVSFAGESNSFSGEVLGTVEFA